MSSSTLYIGLRCPMTSTDAVTAPAARIQKRIASIRLPAVDLDREVRGDQQVHHGERQQVFPAELHQLVVPVPRQRPPHPDVEEQQREHLDQEPDPAELLRQERAVPAAEEE